MQELFRVSGAGRRRDGLLEAVLRGEDGGKWQVLALARETGRQGVRRGGANPGRCRRLAPGKHQ
ncbi:hypothetical protein GMLC_07870 [Geomonas limicola]|uniref:Uncharacterized protein n=1 Tax=Geomonas limicola TaxID=2740186 RepID=A0A6V8N3T7_9BACT|nr:hypothetical protein GMLC_07870 [Geomonas limicola]